MNIPLEDGFSDILNKARRGMGADTVPYASLLDGVWNQPTAENACRAWGLSFPALKAIAGQAWYPESGPLPDGLAIFTTPFSEMTVNSYLVWDPGTREAAAFDTGSDCSEILEKLKSAELKLAGLFLTHTHGDHIFDFDRLVEKTGATAHVSAAEPFDGAVAFATGAGFELGNLRIESVATPGHSPGGTSYIVHGLERPVMIVGDALFAGSVGGIGAGYHEALEKIREGILSRSEKTLLCPGHGPLTTVSEEKRHNPFFA